MNDHPDLNPGTQLAAAHIISLFGSNYAREHGFVDLSCAQMSKNSGGYFSERHLRRQIQILKKAGILAARRAYSSIRLFKNFTASKKFTVMIAATEGDEVLRTPSMSVLLSVLLQKAAFNFRGTGEWFVNASQLKDLEKETALSTRTITDNLKILIKLRLIHSRQFVREKRFMSRPQVCGFSISEILYAAYCAVVKIARSKKVAKIIAAKDGIKSVCKKATRTLRRASRFMAATPDWRAQRPNPIAQKPQFAHSPCTLEKSGQAVGKNWSPDPADFGKKWFPSM